MPRAPAKFSHDKHHYTVAGLAAAHRLRAHINDMGLKYKTDWEWIWNGVTGAGDRTEFWFRDPRYLTLLLLKGDQ